MAGGTYAVIPVKPFASAKRRLSPMLNSVERARLAHLMLCDVLDALRAARGLDGFIVVTGSGEAAALAAERGGMVVAEPGELGLDVAIARGLGAACAVADGVLVVPADIPHLTGAAVDAIVGNTAEGGITLAPAIHDHGTNAISARPGDLLQPQFGACSFARHYRSALSAGAVTRIHVCPVLGHDLDRPRDLLTFLAFATPTRTHAYLATLGIGERFGAIQRAFVPAGLARACA